MANSKSTTKNSFGLGMSVTEAVLKAYDNGTTTPPAILATLMFSFPTLTLATVKAFFKHTENLRTNKRKRKNRNVQKLQQNNLRIQSKQSAIPVDTTRPVGHA